MEPDSPYTRVATNNSIIRLFEYTLLAVCEPSGQSAMGHMTAGRCRDAVKWVDTSRDAAAILWIDARLLDTLDTICGVTHPGTLHPAWSGESVGGSNIVILSGTVQYSTVQCSNTQWSRHAPRTAHMAAAGHRRIRELGFRRVESRAVKGTLRQ